MPPRFNERVEPLEAYDYLTLARQRIFEKIRPLNDEQYAREFPIGQKTLGRTLTHIMISEWYYVQRIQGRDIPPYEEWPIQQENPPPFAVLEAAWTEQADGTRAALDTVRNWNAAIEYHTTGNDDQPEIVTASAADFLTQLAFHEVHHRAQVMNMLSRLGSTTEDLDFNALMFQRRTAP